MITIATNPEGEPSDEIGLCKFTKDLKKRVSTMTRDQARYLVESYYQMQDNRMRAEGQVRSQKDKSHEVLAWVESNASFQERQIASAIAAFAESQPMGRWAMGVCGIGPIIAAGLVAHIDIEKAPTVGHIWRFAGLDPSTKWFGTEECKKWIKEHGGASSELIEVAAMEFGRSAETIRRFATTDKHGKPMKLTDDSLAKSLSRRPHNAALKTLCWKLGESFVKVMNKPEDAYGKVYLKRKAYESAKNESGDYAEAAAAKLKEFPTHAQRAIYKKGKLPPGHLHSRAKHYAVKQFLSDWHAEAYRQRFGKEPPNPYAITILGHAHERKAA